MLPFTTAIGQPNMLRRSSFGSSGRAASKRAACAGEILFQLAMRRAYTLTLIEGKSTVGALSIEEPMNSSIRGWAVAGLLCWASAASAIVAERDSIEVGFPINSM